MGLFDFFKRKPANIPPPDVSDIDLHNGTVPVFGAKVDGSTPYYVLYAMNAAFTAKPVTTKEHVYFQHKIADTVLFYGLVFNETVLCTRKGNSDNSFFQTLESVTFKCNYANVMDHVAKIDFAQYGGCKIDDKQYSFPWGKVDINKKSMCFQYNASITTPIALRRGAFNMSSQNEPIHFSMLSSYSDVVQLMNQEHIRMEYYMSVSVDKQNAQQSLGVIILQDIALNGMMFDGCIIYAKDGTVMKVICGDYRESEADWESWLRKELALEPKASKFCYGKDCYTEYPLANGYLGIYTSNKTLTFEFFNHTLIQNKTLL